MKPYPLASLNHFTLPVTRTSIPPFPPRFQAWQPCVAQGRQGRKKPRGSWIFPRGQANRGDKPDRDEWCCSQKTTDVERCRATFQVPVLRKTGGNLRNFPHAVKSFFMRLVLTFVDRSVSL